ncbi:MAG: sigma 54-interacting transcriptional regulator [Nitrospirae bacterium]|nr:sigma 54-interacting transcriptional regulator [Candidatus Manganitrophaceae bacterium]
MTNNDSSRTFDNPAQRYRTLLEVAEIISVHQDLRELIRDLAQRLPAVVDVNVIGLSLHDPERGVMRLHTVQANIPAEIVGDHDEPADFPTVHVWNTQEILLVPDLSEEPRWRKEIQPMRDDGIRAFCFVPLTTAAQRLGALGFLSLKKGAYGDADLEFLQQIGKLVAVAVENVLNYQSARRYQQQLTRELDRQRLLLEVTNAIIAHLDLRQLLKAISAFLRRVVPHDFAGMTLYDPDQCRLRSYALDSPGHQEFIEQYRDFVESGFPIAEVEVPMLAFTSRRTVLRNLTDLPDENAKRLIAEGLKRICSVPLISHDRVLGTLEVLSEQEAAFSEDDLELLSRVASQIAIAVENALAYQQITKLKDKLAKEKLYLEEEIRTGYDFKEIIGQSAALKKVLKQVETVAPTDSTVLILGETGTGKELIARAIHNLSGRRERTFVKMNCAAIPTGLLESELFGHERGAFTGAIAQKIGRFELAHQGTLFLDEVGDISLELQSKLLQVLQEQEFERLGGTKTIKVNVRLVAATNRDLGQMMAEKAFRNDLYYRLNVFPILLPPLRERREDIPLLVKYFARKYAQRMNKQTETIPSETMTLLMNYPWPGNIRELENVIERSVILSEGAILSVPLAETARSSEILPKRTTTLEAAEREHIMRILDEANWVVGGVSGAAARLGMKRTTLQSRMRKLGISRR